MKLTPQMIRIVRINLGYTQGKLGIKACISVALLGHIERGERRLTSEVEAKIRRVIPLSDDEIIAIYEAHIKLRKGVM